MAQETSFIHTSDLHLNGNKGRFKVLSKIVSLCLKRKVNALLIAGDLFDKDASQETVRKTYAQFNRLKSTQIKVFLIKGDEDTPIKLPKLPSNVKLLKGKGMAHVSLGNYQIGMFHGRSEDLPPRLKLDYFALGHFHDLTKLNARTYYSGSPVPSLKYKAKARYILLVKFEGKIVRPIRIKL